MIKPLTSKINIVILLFHLLFGQKYSHYMFPSKTKTQQSVNENYANYTTKRLITNENVYDINETLEKVFIKGERNER